MLARPRPSLTWLALPLLLAGKQLVAARFAWDYGLARRALIGQGFFALLASLALVAMLRLLSGKRYLGVFLALDAFLSLLLLGDVLHVRQFGTPISAAMFRYAYQLATVRASVWALVQPAHLLLFADLPVLWVLFRARERWEGLAALRPRQALGVVCAAAAVTGGAAMLDGVRPDVWNGHTGVVWKFGFLDYHLLDGFNVASSAARRRTASPETRRRVLEAAAARRREAGPGRFHGVAPRANLIVIQVESLQAFARGMRVGGVAVTPSLDALARESFVATSFFHQTGPGRTSDADLLFNCSLYPAPDGSAYFQYEQNDYYCLPEVLAEAGYRTAAFQATFGDLWNVSRVYQRLGYQEFASLESFTLDEPIGVGLSDASFLRQTLQRIARLPEPFFAFAVTLTSHVPFEHGLPLPQGPLSGTMAGRYLEAIRYTDSALGTFVEGLRASGLLDRTVLVVYGDHDGVPWSPELGRALGLGDDPVSRFLLVRKVPLLIRFPGGRNAGASDEPLGQIDLAPTLVSALGVRADRALFLGREVGSPSAPVLVFPYGEALDARRLFLPEMGASEVSRCVALDGRAPRPVDRCADIARRAANDLETSRALLEYDLQAGGREGEPLAKVR